MSKPQKLPSGNWRVEASKNINGKRIRKSFTDPDKRKAELLAAQWLTEQEQTEPCKLTLRQAFERYIASRENVLSPNTTRVYSTIQNSHLQSIMHIPVDKLTSEQIQIAINEDAETSSPKTIRNVNGLLSAVLKTYRPNFTPNVTLPQRKPTNLYVPDDNEIKKILAAVKNTEMEVPILLAAFGPMRRGEICALTSDDVKGNVISVTKAVANTKDGRRVVKLPKTESSNREIEYPDFVIEKIKNIEGQITNISPAHISRRFRVILKNCNIPDFRFHDLRHYAVSTLHAINVPDKYIQARGGWATADVMQRVYNHTLKNKKDEFKNRIIDHFSDIFLN